MLPQRSLNISLYLDVKVLIYHYIHIINHRYIQTFRGAVQVNFILSYFVILVCFISSKEVAFHILRYKGCRGTAGHKTMRQNNFTEKNGIMLYFTWAENNNNNTKGHTNSALTEDKGLHLNCIFCGCGRGNTFIAMTA